MKWAQHLQWEMERKVFGKGNQTCDPSQSGTPRDLLTTKGTSLSWFRPLPNLAEG